MDLSPEDIELLTTSEGKGFTWAKLQEWGVPTPPKKGWRTKLLKELGLERKYAASTNEEFSLRQHWQEHEAREQDVRSPEEIAALEAMHVGHQALVNLGWRDACYCPKDKTYFFAICAGSMAVVPTYYDGDWPKGTYWACCSGDLWPVRPILFKPASELELKRFYGQAD